MKVEIELDDNGLKHLRRLRGQMQKNLDSATDRLSKYIVDRDTCKDEMDRARLESLVIRNSATVQQWLTFRNYLNVVLAPFPEPQMEMFKEPTNGQTQEAAAPQVQHDGGGEADAGTAPVDAGGDGQNNDEGTGW